MKKRLIAVALTMAMAAGMMTGCGGSGKTTESAAATAAADAGNTEAAKTEAAKEQEDKTEAAKDDAAAGGAGALIGVAMPTKDLQRWNQDGSNMKAELEAAGYAVDLQYASNDVQTQVSQI